MPTNVEVKARLADKERALEAAKRLSDSQGTILQQEDTFFNIPEGRLKLRIQNGSPGQLIFYKRKDVAGPKLSDYSIARTEGRRNQKWSGPTIEAVQQLSIRGNELVAITVSANDAGCVKKTRLLFLVGQTRIHIDSVQGLGHFLELEVVMSDGQEFSQGQQIATDLMQRLGVSEQDLVTGAYMDLLLQAGNLYECRASLQQGHT